MRQEAEARLRDLHTRVLSNLIMLGQIPAPTGDEKERGKYLKERFTALGLEDISEDTFGNVFARRPGAQGRKTLALFAGIDTVFPKEVGYEYDVTPTQVIGPGVSYDSLAASSLISIAEFFTEWDRPLKDDILFVGLARCADQADQEGMRKFLESPLSRRIDGALMLESIGLGRLSYFSFGALKFDLTIDLPQGQLGRVGVSRSSAIEILADAVNLIQGIELPRHPKAGLNLGVIEGGESHEFWATKAKLGAEIRSESTEILAGVEEEVDEIALHLGSYYGCKASLRKFGRRTTAGLRFTHPIVRAIRRLLHGLDILPAPGPDTMAGSLAMAAGIPTVTLGLTQGTRAGKRSIIEIEPIHTGLLQVILALHQLGDLLE